MQRQDEALIKSRSLSLVNALVASQLEVDPLDDLLAHHLVLLSVVGDLDLVRVIEGGQDDARFLLTTGNDFWLAGDLLVLDGKVLKQEVNELGQWQSLTVVELLNFLLQFLEDRTSCLFDLLILRLILLGSEFLVERHGLIEPQQPTEVLSRANLNYLSRKKR